jgi:hypothetical protein
MYKSKDLISGLRHYEGTLGTFFPPEDEHSPWLIRLMILRDDLNFEAANLPIRGDTIEDTWKCCYFLRRMSVTLWEAKHICARQLTALCKSPQDRFIAELSKRIRKFVATVDRWNPFIEQLRNSTGGHVRPKPEHLGANVLANHKDSYGQITIDSHAKNTRYSGMTFTAAFYLAWPDADDSAKLIAKHEELRQAVLDLAPQFFDIADALLGWHWYRYRAVLPPPGQQFGIRDEDTDEYIPIDESWLTRPT